jgi:hypothetical protein
LPIKLARWKVFIEQDRICNLTSEYRVIGHGEIDSTITVTQAESFAAALKAARHGDNAGHRKLARARVRKLS